MPYVSGLYTGINYLGASINNAEQVTMLDDYLKLIVKANKQDSIVSIFIMPKTFYTAETTPVFKEFDVVVPSNIDGYYPRNNKLLTYPYCFLTVDCLNDCKTYRYEFSKDKNFIHFMVQGCVSPNVEILLAPRQYNGTVVEVENTHGTANLTEALIMTGFPQCAFSIDAYRAWLAQKSVGAVITGATQIGVGVASGMTGNPIGIGYAGAGLAHTVSNAIIEATKGSTARGNQGGNALVASRSKDFYFKRMSITAEFAEMIDSFFDKYGYTVNRVKKPYRHARTYWSYVKTRDCNVYGSIPADDVKKINEIYNKGVTFWSLHTMTGDYSKAEDNRPIPAEYNNWY